jgi:hypothetical protein
MRFFRLFVTAVVVLFAASVPIGQAVAAGNPISIQQCFITAPKALSKNASGTQIVYVNRGMKTAAHVTFGVGYRNSDNHFDRKVTDDGNFAPGVTIDHHFDLYKDVTYGGKAARYCYATSVTWADGTIWKAY